MHLIRCIHTNNHDIERDPPLVRDEERNREELQIAQLLCSTARFLKAGLFARLTKMVNVFSSGKEECEPGADGNGGEWTV